MPDRTENSDGSTTQPTKQERPHVDRKARLLLEPNFPVKQPAEVRNNNWDEVFHLFDAETAKAEATRCIQCPAAPCITACPVGNDIPGAFWLLEQGDFNGAANIFRETNELPEVCGRICPQERLCEGHCVVGKKNLPVAIGKLEAFVTEWQRSSGSIPLAEIPPATGKRLAVIGSGPAGIGVAERIAIAGHQVVVYDAWPVAGGLLHYGIPNFKQNKSSIAAKIEDLCSLGVEFILDTHVGSDVTFSDLEHNFDAIFIAAGAIAGVELGIENENAPGVYSATEFLVRGNLPPDDLPDSLRTPLPEFKSVVVIGGGDTSMDCVRTAIRLGADTVKLVYRRTEEEMQGREEERLHAHEEGVIFEFLTSPTSITVDSSGTFKALQCQRMRLGEPDESGRARPQVIPNSDFEITADALVLAIGYNVNDEWGTVTPELKRDPWGRITVDPETMRTNRDGVFAGGDDVNGADLVVTALADARIAAESIMEYFNDGS